MIFTKYRSMENSYRELFMNKIRDNGFTIPSIRWMASEKIHGANSGLVCDGEEVRMSKKTALIGKTENFFGATKLLEKYKSDALGIFEALKLEYKNIKTITIFGELFGGSYPHKDIKSSNHAKKVQKGIFYTPYNEFLVFDIMITLDTNEDIYLSWTDVVDLIDNAPLLRTVPVLVKGTFDEMIAYPNDGQSVVHKIFGLPAIEDNIMEGVVLKPIESSFLPNGSRVIIKNKNDKWSEKSKEPKRKAKEVNEAIRPIVEEIELYITENRLRNVLSHIGEVTNRDFGLINKEFIGDVMKDYIIENGNEKINVLDKNDRKLISKSVGKQTALLIRKNFLNIIDNMY